MSAQPILVAALTTAFVTVAGCQSASIVPGEIVAERLKAPTIDNAERCKAETLAIGVPKFPSDALRRRTEGWALVSYDLDGSGRPANITIVGSSPTGIFEQSTIDVLRDTKFVVGAKRTGCKSLVTYALR